MLKKKYEDCKHEWTPHFHEVVDKTKTTMRVAVCITCKKCGMFRTKVLELRYPENIQSIN